MTFGKRGRPPEDRLARQGEIYTAVAPLIEREGARRLSMRQAAQAACLSIGGLYHYFPTKRELVLHGLCLEAILRRCEDFHAQFEHLVETDPQQYIKEGIDLIVSHVGFCRPALHAALELGAESFWEVIETLLTGTEQAFEVNLQRQLPEASDQEVQRCGRAINRALCAALLDKRISPDELRDELRILFDGYVSRAQAHAAP
ncbi:MAG: TetR/AcrR family transcriptional regulator [Kouleothrix sp.]|jgi:AcrR family transcriptional regulator|nr:TetR/AcrR family transcriptional regulator [Kouleothrix sp.]